MAARAAGWSTANTSCTTAMSRVRPLMLWQLRPAVETLPLRAQVARVASLVVGVADQHAPAALAADDQPLQQGGASRTAPPRSPCAGRAVGRSLS